MRRTTKLPLGRAARLRTLVTAGLAAALLVGAFGSSGAYAGVKTAPDKRRVDLAQPSFSDPTSITNPLFPKSTHSQVIQLGVEGGDKLRFEVTQLPQTKTVKWNGQRVQTVVTHFVAYTNGRLVEIAHDFYAQADDGAVWYFGEDVDNYENGVLANHDGTWLAGKDGPPGMIMPANPQVGDVFRPENIPGLVFEEVTVKAVGKTVPGPRGPVKGAIRIQARLMDGTVEEKVFAPGYGEFQGKVASLDELYNVALAVPIDALPGPVPGELSELSAGSGKIFRAAPSKRWHRISAILDRMTAAWDAHRVDNVPKLLDKQMSDALDAMHAAVDARKPADVRQAAINVAQASLDLQLQYRPRVDIDRARLGQWRRQLLVDRAAHDAAAVAGDLVTLKAIRDRIDH